MIKLPHIGALRYLRKLESAKKYPHENFIKGSEEYAELLAAGLITAERVELVYWERRKTGSWRRCKLKKTLVKTTPAARILLGLINGMNLIESKLAQQKPVAFARIIGNLERLGLVDVVMEGTDYKSINLSSKLE